MNQLTTTHVTNGSLRVDLELIAAMIAPNGRVLDIGCGDGTLLAWLGRHKGVDGRGIELSMSGVSQAVAQGLSVVQGDADTDLKYYPDGAFDTVILSQAIQVMREPKAVLEQMLRIGRRAIVSFPNFGHWRSRLSLLLRGRMPVTEALTHQWYDTPNIHFCTIRDFRKLCQDLGVVVEHSIALDRNGYALPWKSGVGRMPNLFAEQALCVLRRD